MGCSINMAWTLIVLAAAASMAAIQATPARVHPVAQTDSGGCEDAIYANDGGQGFAEYFDDGKDGLLQDWFFSGPWGNGHPFDVGFDPYYYNINDQNVLELLVKRELFSNNGQSYPFTAGEIKSRNFYSAGCYSVCMKPSGQSGTSSSFYAFSGFYDSATPRTESNSGDPHFHNELDIEFVGKNTSQVQTNYYARHSYRQDPNVVGTGSGVESLHDLGFDAAGRFHPYTIRWTQAGIEWFAGDRLLRKVRREDDPNMPDPAFGPLRISANVWVADGAARGWTGELADGFYGAKSEYAWMKFTPGEACAPEPHCGFHQNGVDATGMAGGIR